MSLLTFILTSAFLG